MVEYNMNAAKVFQKYGLEVEETEPAVYRVFNTDKEVDTDNLQLDLLSCILITSDDTRYLKMDTGVAHMFAHIYYIIIDRSKRELGYKYKKMADDKFGESLYKYFEYKPEYENSIDTIYAKGELL